MVLGGGEGAVPTGIVRARWVVRVVEVYYEPTVLGSEVRVLYGIKQVPASAVGLARAGQVLEGEQDSAPVAGDPEQRQREFIVFNPEADPAEAPKPHRTIVLQGDLQRPWFDVALDGQREPEGRIIVEVAQP